MKLDLPKTEEKILKFWRENRVFEKSIKQRTGAQDFVFYEGPPTANAKPGIHHVLSRVYKDIICRYKTMRGFRVLRKAGWDTHGLPVELEIEKKLGLKNRKDIEKYGIAKFNKLCKQSVWNYKKDWEKLTERIAFWLDIKDSYITYESDYIETLWSIIKQIHQKGFLYRDYKVVPYCPRCGTSLSSHEVAQGYKKIKEPTIYIKLQLKAHLITKQPHKAKHSKPNTYLLVWTTTPWTLPGNIAVAINPEFTYIKVKIDNEYLILAKERVKALGIKGEIIKEFKGKDLLGLEYEPLYPVPETEITTRIIAGDFVTLKEGTGLVHIAPAFGEEDMTVAKQQISIDQFQILKPVDEQGKMITPNYEWDKIFVKNADPLIIEDLRKKGLLFKEELYEHDYPFCWRCGSPLLYYAKESWFIKMQAVKKDLIKNNQKINWIPAHLQKGRFGEWLKELKDWAFSRERYWGTPLPIWQCKKCCHQEVIGSKKDLLKQKFSSNRYFILRHGESLRQLNDFSSCWPEKILCPLTLKGKEQIKEVAKKLKNKKIDLIFSSDLLRTKQTAEIVRKELGLKLINLDKRLREINVGTLNGKPMKEVRKFWGRQEELSTLEYTLKRFQIAPAKGENYFDLEKRMLDFIKEISEKYQGKNILIISHERPFTLLEKVILGYDLKKFTKILLSEKYIKPGELRELKFKNLPYNEKMEIDFHRPYIDEVRFNCPKCSDIMERVSEVIDCWFDSGAMPFAQAHQPFSIKNKKCKKYSPPKLFPADYICEAIDQTRGWFYTLLAISTLLNFGPPYKNVISLSHVLDKKGEKMSKSKNNVIDPWQIIEKYGSDSLRWYFYTINQPGNEKLFSERDVEQSLKRFIMIFWNSYLFYQTYADALPKSFQKNCKKPRNILDQWIISKLNELIWQITEKLDKYDVTSAARTLENFVINDFSQWYIRRSRRRFQKPKTKKELKQVSETLWAVLLTLSKLTAPFIPFLSEEIYKRAAYKSAQSVHLENWPNVNKKLINKKLNQKMERVRELVALALAERAKVGIKVRQPLASLKIKGKIDVGLLELIKEEINVKKLIFDNKIKTETELDTKITSELREEGIIKEIIRQIQEMRKKASLKPKDKISVQCFGTLELNKILKKNKNFFLTESTIQNFILKKESKKDFTINNEIKIVEQNLWLSIKKI